MTAVTAPTSPLRVLIVDDSEHDAKLMALALKQAGILATYDRVDTAQALQDHLSRTSYSVVLTDHAMPALDSLRVLGIVSSSAAPPPVIVVSGQIGEETLATAFHAGAEDYVSKDRLSPLLGVAVARVLDARRAKAQLEEASWQLRRQEKAAALRTFVSGVAHEINNPLSFMVMGTAMAEETVLELRRTETAAERAAQLDDVRDTLQRTAQGCERIATIVRGLQRVVQSGNGKRVRVAANDVVQRSLIEPPAGIRLSPSLRSARQVNVDERDLRDVLHALLRNAYEAMAQSPEAGAEVEVLVEDTAKGVAIEVVDHGPGIPPEVQPSIFTPFFTTKNTGVGLSLSIAQRLIEDHGGTIGFASTPGKGARFRIDLPAADAAVPETPTLPAVHR